MPSRPEIHGSSVVVRGSFTPATFQPGWLASLKLLSQKEADAADIKLIHPTAAIFSLEEWLEIQVLDNRFMARTRQEAFFEPVRDLAIGIFDVLDQTPVRALGINQFFHYRLPSEEEWHRVGHRLVPKENWEDKLSKPGMRSLLVEGVRPDEREGYIRVQVGPSTKFPKSGVFIEVNDHYQFAGEDPIEPGTEELRSILATEWERSMHRGVKIAEQLISDEESQ